MVKHVAVVAKLMIAHGILVSAVGLFWTGMGLFTYFGTEITPPPGQAGPNPGETIVLAAVSGTYLLFGTLTLAAGILNIAAGVRSLSFRGRTLGLVALFGNLAPMLTLVCMPTSLGLMIYGLIVFYHADVARAFALVAEGVPAAHFKCGRRADPEEGDGGGAEADFPPPGRFGEGIRHDPPPP